MTRDPYRIVTRPHPVSLTPILDYSPGKLVTRCLIRETLRTEFFAPTQHRHVAAPSPPRLRSKVADGARRRPHNFFNGLPGQGPPEELSCWLIKAYNNLSGANGTGAVWERQRKTARARAFSHKLWIGFYAHRTGTQSPSNRSHRTLSVALASAPCRHPPGAEGSHQKRHVRCPSTGVRSGDQRKRRRRI